MSSRTILAVLLAASLAGNASFVVTTLVHRPPKLTGAVDRLALTADQVSRFQGARQAFQEERTRARARMAELRGVLADEFAKEAPDRQRLVNAAVEMAEVQATMRPKLMDHLLALHALLDPEQRVALAETMRVGGGAGDACPGATLYSTPEQEGESKR